MNLLYCGDISFSSIEHFEFSLDVRKLFREQDLVKGNLEAVITGSEAKLSLHPVHYKTKKDETCATNNSMRRVLLNPQNEEIN